ncbi:hypothetical protein GCM10027429_19000 [Marivirga atlantica]|uniref:Chorismate-binding protein n=1 Tax=Marivirga atlantica TaxID=1548457 RepID=A0A937A849_9BACT|nr:chorismate-binding protein [Marivirga atlantica]MBL0765517.1 chorismate-binding protein [Marivirga atlantica]
MENRIQETSTIKKLTAAEWVNKLIQFTQSVGGACAVWKLPNDNTINLLADLKGGDQLSELELDELSEGFLMAPFDVSEAHYLHFKPDLQATINMPEFADSNDTIEIEWNAENEVNVEKFRSFIKQQKTSVKLKPLTSNVSSTTKEAYVNNVEKGVEAIKAEQFYKVVPSKIKVIESQKTPNIGQAYLNTANKYPNAFVSLTVSPDSGIWLGATPEILIEDVHNGHFKTVALAGTQRKTERPIAETAWTQKEIEEQAYVSRYIINCFKKIRLREYEEIGPKTIEAGHLLHLKTTYKVDKQAVNFPELASVMLKLLHPTSAVCGMPKDAALQFINETEAHERSYFSGFLGPIHKAGKTNLFVNLRCCQFFEGAVAFYAGAGITEDSNPEKEWEETEMKCDVLASVIL